jgi:hypothetical protein
MSAGSAVRDLQKKTHPPAKKSEPFDDSIRAGVLPALPAILRSQTQSGGRRWLDRSLAAIGLPIATEQLWKIFHNCSVDSGAPPPTAD